MASMPVILTGIDAIAVRMGKAVIPNMGEMLPKLHRLVLMTVVTPFAFLETVLTELQMVYF